MRKADKRINKLVITALMSSLIMLMTFIIRIPVPATQGYIHLGDCMIFLGVLVLGWRYGTLAAAIGSALADLMGGYAIYAPVTFLAKGIMAASVGLFIEWAVKKEFKGAGFAAMEAVGMVIGGVLMVAGYYFAESLMYGSFIVPLAGVPMNILQFTVGIAIAVAIAHALEGTPVGKVWEYNLKLVRAGKGRSKDRPLRELQS